MGSRTGRQRPPPTAGCSPLELPPSSTLWVAPSQRTRLRHRVDPQPRRLRLVASDGGVFSFNASFEGSLGSLVLNAQMTGMAATDDGLGYWMVGADGGVLALGDALFLGSPGKSRPT